MNIAVVKRKIKLINFWPPFFGSGIVLKHINDDYTKFEVELKLRWWNRNTYGTQYGGSLYSMADAFYATICLFNLGKDYIVWDKSAKIEFIHPGTSNVTATFEIDRRQLEQIKEEVDRLGKNTYFFSTEIRDIKGKVVAKVQKEIYIRKRCECFQLLKLPD